MELTKHQQGILQTMIEADMPPEDIAKELDLPPTVVVIWIRQQAEGFSFQQALISEYIRTDTNRPTIAALCHAFCISPTKLYSILSNQDPPIQKRQARVAAIGPQVCLMYQNGHTIADIRKNTSLSPNTIYTLLDRAGVPRRRSPWTTQKVTVPDATLTTHQAIITATISKGEHTPKEPVQPDAVLTVQPVALSHGTERPLP